MSVCACQSVSQSDRRRLRCARYGWGGTKGRPKRQAERPSASPVDTPEASQRNRSHYFLSFQRPERSAEMRKNDGFFFYEASAQ